MNGLVIWIDKGLLLYKFKCNNRLFGELKMKSINKFSNKKAFTLIELIMVIAIIVYVIKRRRTRRLMEEWEESETEGKIIRFEDYSENE